MPSTKITLRFDSFKSELDKLAVTVDGIVEQPRPLGTAKAKLRQRKLSILGLIVCKLRSEQPETPLPIAPHWNDLLRALKHKETDPCPNWSVKLYSGKIFEFYCRPPKDCKEISFLSDAHSRIEVLVGGEAANQSTLRELAIYYRSKCAGDASALLTQTIGDEELRKKLCHTAARESDLTFDPDMGTLIGKYIWYAGWGEIRHFLSKEGSRGLFFQVEVELGERLRFITDLEDVAPLRGYLSQIRESFNELSHRRSYLIKEIQEEITGLLESGKVVASDHKSVDSHAARFAQSLSEAIRALDESIEQWLKTVGSANEQNVDRGRLLVLKQTKNLHGAMSQIEVLVIKRLNHCRESIKAISTQIALAPRDKVKASLGW